MDTLFHYASIAFFWYKIFAIIVTAFSVAGIVYVAKKSGEMRELRAALKQSQQFAGEPAMSAASNSFALGRLKDSTIEHWHTIVEKLGKQTGEKDFKSALIEADALVDAALLANGFPGETMGDRLKAVPVGRLSLRDDLWKAHRVRNDIAHNPRYIVSPRQGHDMMKIYKKALEELGAL